MRHAWVFLLVPTSAYAQKVDTQPERRDTLRILVTGEIDFDGVYRNDTLTAGGAGGGGSGSPTWSAEGDVRLRLDIEMQERISAVVSLRTQRLTGAAAGVVAAENALVLLGPDTNRFGANPEETRLLVDEASVTLNEFIDPVMRLTAGIVPVSFDVRGRGSAFFFDPRHSSTFGKNVGTSGQTVFGLADELQPAGVVVSYVRDAFNMGVFLLPAVIEGGDVATDEAAYGFWFLFTPKLFAEGTRFGFLATVDSFAGSDTSVWTTGGGLDLHGVVDGLEIYAESYFQYGEAGPDQGARGWAFQIGVEYRLPENDNNIWFGASFLWVSGDGDATDDEVRSFLSYENVNDLLVLEDQTFGLDLDTNYYSLKLGGGLAFHVGSGKKNLEVSLLVGINRLHEEISIPGAASRSIGHEIDLRARYLATKALSFDLAFGFLFNSEVLEELFAAPGDDAVVWVMGTTVRF